MFLTFFKTITSVLLVVVLVVVVSHREIVMQQKTKFFPGTKKVSKLSDNQELEKNENTETIILPMSTSTQAVIESLPYSPAKTTSPITVTINQVPKIATARELPKEPQYLNLETGSSDTDESYYPSVSPCKVTMKYRIGRFDTNFGISQSMFIDEINSAGSLWGDELNKKLFSYDEKGSLIINLIYDERQARTDAINNLALEIQNSKDAANSLKNLYEQEKTIYLGDGKQLTKDSDALTERYKLYTEKVTLYNSKGGAPQAEYEVINQELTYLKNTSNELEARRNILLSYMEKINAKVNHYNELVIYINSLIKESNALGAKKFTEGRFNPNTNTIDIFQYNNTIKLRRVISHELGHVLGINHNKNAYSIMYSMNSATTTVLSNEDILDLKKVCPR